MDRPVVDESGQRGGVGTDEDIGAEARLHLVDEARLDLAGRHVLDDELEIGIEFFVAA